MDREYDRLGKSVEWDDLPAFKKDKGKVGLKIQNLQKKHTDTKI